MTLIVAGTFEVDPAERDAFIASRTDGMRNSRAEKGCLQYAFTADPLEPGRVLLFEIWESKEDLAAHLQAMRASSPPPSGGVRPKSADVKQYTISDVGAVGS